MTVYLTIGNSDDKLTQKEWSRFFDRTDHLVRAYASTVYGVWTSLSNSPYQNACWGFDLPDDFARNMLRTRVPELAAEYRQDSIAWVEGEVDFVSPERQDA